MEETESPRQLYHHNNGSFMFADKSNQMDAKGCLGLYNCKAILAI